MFFLLLIFLAWGSYLNSLGHRLLHLEDFFKTRSFCPSCKLKIAWYDNLPIISWLLLQARCRSCKQSISWLYPFIEIITPISLYALWHMTSPHFFPAYFIFFSALIVTIRTDFDEMLISRFVTLYLIPIGLIAAYFHYLPLSFNMAIIGSVIGYSLLWIVKKLTTYLTHQEGLGQGDLELLALIGAFTGPLGCWISLLIGSVVGTIYGLLYMVIFQTKIIKIPFGPYLSFGAIIFVLFQNFFIHYFFNL